MVEAYVCSVHGRWEFDVEFAAAGGCPECRRPTTRMEIDSKARVVRIVAVVAEERERESETSAAEHARWDGVLAGRGPAVCVLGPHPASSDRCSVCERTLREERDGGRWLGPAVALDVGGVGVVAHTACALEEVAAVGEELATMLEAQVWPDTTEWRERWRDAWEITQGDGEAAK